jgi:hypothetical protein
MNPLSEQEVRDFIHKLRTESTNVLVLFFNVSLGITFTLPGRLTLDEPSGVITVQTEELGFSKTAVFKTSLKALLAVPCGFSDPRDLVSPPPGFEREFPMSFGLGFPFPDGSNLVLIDVSAGD